MSALSDLRRNIQTACAAAQNKQVTRRELTKMLRKLETEARTVEFTTNELRERVVQFLDLDRDND